MPIDRPKILTRLTVPTGGWVLTIVAELGQGGEDSFTATVPAGDYYVSQDNQSDDFLKALCVAVNAQGAATMANWDDGPEGMVCTIDDDKKVVITFIGDYFQSGDGRNIQIRWTQTDGDEIGAVLGFDTSADLTFPVETEPSSTGDWQHAYGWYANTDGQLSSLGIEDSDNPNFEQQVAPSGHVKTTYMGSMMENELSLTHVPRVRTWSNGVGYTTDSVHPYAKNVPLECWWHSVKNGTEFRVYRNDPP